MGEVTLEYHEAANIFPLMEEEEFGQLVASIAKNGLLEPIQLLEGKVLDGRNRLLACKMASVEPRFVAAKVNGSATDYVLAMNLDRRHLGESQRAMVAADAKKLYAKEAKERQTAAQNNNAGRAVGANLHQQGNGKAIKARANEQAAAALNVSPRTVASAAKVKARGTPELVQAVNAGKVAVSTAAKLADLPAAVQREAVAGGKEATREAIEAAAPKKKIADTFFNALRGLADRINGIREQYGTAQQMFESTVWSGNDTTTVIELVHELSKMFQELDKEMQAYDRQRKKREA